MDKQVVLKTWVSRGIRQLFLSHIIDKYYYFSNEKAFNMVQGIELILKACILAQKESLYKDKTDREAQVSIENEMKMRWAKSTLR